MSETTIGITSFLRPGYLGKALAGIQEFFPEFRILIADDSDCDNPGSRNEFAIDYSAWLDLPFDSGLCAKRNALLNATKTEYFLLGTDDFVFDEQARIGVETMTSVLNSFPDIDVVTGRVNHKPYEGFISVSEDTIAEVPLHLDRDDIPVQVDLAANYFLGRTKRLLPWRGDFKIGGEHIVWFLDMKNAGRKIYWVPGVNINTQLYDPAKQDPRYNEFRRRARHGHEQMKKLLGIERYIDFYGGVS